MKWKKNRESQSALSHVRNFRCFSFSINTNFPTSLCIPPSSMPLESRYKKEKKRGKVDDGLANQRRQLSEVKLGEKKEMFDRFGKISFSRAACCWRVGEVTSYSVRGRSFSTSHRS